MTEENSFSLEAGCEVIRRYLPTLPDAPGVYRMIDAKGDTLYVGKARYLKRRVGSYAKVAANGIRIQRMVSQIATIEVTATRSEAEALLLEANLIKKLSPRYNILLKDDKSFPYIFFSGDHDFPRLSKHRGAKTKKGRYFGPFVSAGAVNETLALLQKAFLLRPCADTIFKGRTRPCLQYQIKRCSAPCVNKISKEEYANLVSQAQDFLTGKSRQIQDQLIAEMQELSLKMDYEKARVVRDRIKALAQVQQKYGTQAAQVGNADIVAMARDGKQCCVVMISFRSGYNYGSKSWFPVHTASYDDAEVLRVFIGQVYQTQKPPGLILTSHLLEDAALLEEALRMNTDYKVEIVHPLRGEKRELVEQAAANARQELTRHIALHSAQRDVLEKLRDLFGLDEVPERIEVYDNSHISGTHAVGAMIVGGQEGFAKSEYRKFNIKSESITPGDDYGMMREVLSRRFKGLQESGSIEKMPDLILIDGGQGQLSAAMSVFEDLGVEVPVVAIAKGPDRNAGREQFFLPGRTPFQLPPDDAVLHFLQRLRDEAHRFAIGAHRQRRTKAMQTSKLDAIPFIGPNRKKALLNYFGSPKAVAAAGMAEIEKVPGISKSTAKVIYEYFNAGE